MRFYAELVKQNLLRNINDFNSRMIVHPKLLKISLMLDVKEALKVPVTRDDSVDPTTARLVRLGGHDFHIAPLSLRQILAIADYVPKLSGITAENLSGERLIPLAEVLWHGLRRAYPGLTRDEFFDLPITIAELVAALPVVIEQAGGRKVDATAGETVAASASMPSTGVRSSPIS
jgi:hypothetical protein